MTPEKLNDLRKRVLENLPYTREELAEAVRSCIADRLSQVEPVKTKSTATKVPSTLLDKFL